MIASPIASPAASSLLRIDALRAAPVVREPFEFVVVPHFIDEGWRVAVARDFPPIATPGSFPLDRLSYGPAFSALLAELQGDEFRAAIGEKFDVDLRGYPTLVTVRGQCGPRDGAVHTDAAWKLMSVLLYLNDGWMVSAGCLRLLRSRNLDDVALEIPPEWGMLLVFRRSAQSFHGHTRFRGRRRVLQLNWVQHERFVLRETARHRRSALLKRWFHFAA